MSNRLSKDARGGTEYLNENIIGNPEKATNDGLELMRPPLASDNEAATEIVIIASGMAYQEAASWAASTYAVNLRRNDSVSVLLPEGEQPLDMLKARADQFGFAVKLFPLRIVSEKKFTSQLKCQAFLFALALAKIDQMILFSDADMCCLKPLSFLPEVTNGIAYGKIGMVKDSTDHHCKNPKEPWYLTEDERVTYVNSGLIVAGRSALDFFEDCVTISERPEFLRGPFNDQKVINFAFGKRFRDRLMLLSQSYNVKGRRITEETIIGHYRGGTGRLGKQQRKWAHIEMCARVLQTGGAQSRHLAQHCKVLPPKAAWKPPANTALKRAFDQAIKLGRMAENQYRYIAEILCSDASCSLLVFGGGHDAELWYYCVQGRIAYVEDKRKYLEQLPANGVYFKFESKVGFWSQPPPPPEMIDHSWDYILVDAPAGFNAGCPGRQIPIAWAARLARKAVFLHDYERAWERAVGDRYLGAPNSVIKAKGRGDQKLAVYDRSGALSSEKSIASA